ncbi:T-cell surface glycoprotein CD3 gamma chain-like isoform X1 [Candoia aspera]|uniref:T-cell surface glycoprotein CD3 gamma chain-like isoform X1 n=1 Tax=Candoia aspera TaxID=51853 RepID=UPI002FD7C975
MGGWEQLLCATVLGLFFQGISISGNAASENEFIIIKQKGKTVSLICEGGNNKTSWRKDRTALRHKGKELALGAMMDDPRGFYECSISDKENRSLQVFFRMCQNCIHLDFITVLGISAASLFATVFLAVAVYHIAVGERGWPSQASDKQSLLASDQLYQPLREHNYGPYSHIGAAKPRHR